MGVAHQHLKETQQRSGDNARGEEFEELQVRVSPLISYNNLITTWRSFFNFRSQFRSLSLLPLLGHFVFLLSPLRLTSFPFFVLLSKAADRYSVVFEDRVNIRALGDNGFLFGSTC